jgi:hypothetical protein
MKVLTWLGVFLFSLSACDGDGGPSMSGSDALPEDKAGPPGPDVAVEEDSQGPPFSVELEELWVDSQGISIYAQYWKPSICTSGSPCPAFLLVPDELGDGSTQFESVGKGLAQSLRSVVITYNPPGRGIGSQLSGGEEDFGGAIGQDALKDVANFIRKKGPVDEGNFGFVSVGFGLGAAAGALARFQDTSLSFIGYLIDIEGPTNRCFISQSPYYVNKAEDYYINEDGKGVSTTRCDFDFNTRKQKFPAGTSSDGKGTDGTPNCYICNENAFVLRQSGKSCEDDKWWGEREAKTYLPKLTCHYLRIQFLHDHVQPTRYNAREALQWITLAETKSYQINSVTEGNNLKGYDEATLESKGVYLKPKAGNGFGTDIYDANDDFKPLSRPELFLSILPPYIERMQKRAAE